MTNEAKEFLIWMCERAESITLQAFRVESNCDELTLFGADDRVIGRFIDVDGWFEVGGARAIAALEPAPAEPAQDHGSIPAKAQEALAEAPAVQIPEGFTAWEGGECPVPLGTPLIVVHRDGDVLNATAGKGVAADWQRTEYPEDGDIIAYRIVQPAQGAATAASDAPAATETAQTEETHTDPAPDAGSGMQPPSADEWRADRDADDRCKASYGMASANQFAPGFLNAHDSDCATHNAPALPPGGCDCNPVAIAPGTVEPDPANPIGEALANDIAGKFDSYVVRNITGDEAESLMMQGPGPIVVVSAAEQTTVNEFVLEQGDIPLEQVTPPGEGWKPISAETDGLIIKRDTEFFCADGVVRQRRIAPGEESLTIDLNAEPVRFTQMRDWKPALDWAPYYGMTPPSHRGYRLETSVRVSDAQPIYRYVPSDRDEPFEPDGWISVSDMTREDLDEALASVGLVPADEHEVGSV